MITFFPPGTGERGDPAEKAAQTIDGLGITVKEWVDPQQETA